MMRSHQEEWMDDPQVPEELLREGLDGLARVNSVLFGHGPSVQGVFALAGGRRRLSVLDVGTGCADTARRLVEGARSRSVDLYVRGIDRSLPTVDHARHRCIAYPEIEISLQDLFTLRDDETFDVVHAALLLHHLDDDQAVEALRLMFRHSRLGVVINDLHRHRLAYESARVALPLISRSPMVRHDGPLSVLRGFTREELFDLVARAGIGPARIRWWPFFRWQVLISRDGL